MIISTIIVALICAFIFYHMGSYNGKQQAAVPAAPKPVQPVCGCRHHFSFHDPKTGECHNYQEGVVERDVKTGSTTMIQCKCRRYVGPEPLPDLYAPEISAE